MSLFKIGEAAKQSGIPASTLRYYDQIGLIRSRQIDPHSKYRYYTQHDITHMKIVQHLRRMDFSLEEVQLFLNERDMNLQLGLLDKKKQEIKLKRLALLQTEKEVHRRIESIEKELISTTITKKDSWEIVVKHFDERPILSKRKIFDRGGIDIYQDAFLQLLKENSFEDVPVTSLVLQHHHIQLNEEFSHFERHLPEIDLEVGVLLPSMTSPFQNATLPSGSYACIVSRGMAGKERFRKLYSFLQEWLQENNYKVEGPLIDIVLTDLTQLTAIDYTEDILSETQFRITPNNA
ncbi:MerR family transcriptional regulator [Exiguobacterium indicum]|uniref:MerR family transcriptional regulator n=1 Tax=Exiguobacterium indicum TaxID=296995 RepID=A0ABU8ELT0_9BACL|nr:MerR family transcriptional regulator [Exiguobacterium sp. OS-77]